MLPAGGGRYALSFPAGRGLKLALRIAGYGLAAAGLGGAVYAIVSLHPHQQLYFSWLADRAAPGELGQQYDMDYWRVSQLQGLEYLLERYPDTTLYVMDWAWPRSRAKNRVMLPATERERIPLSDDVWQADFHIVKEEETQVRVMVPEPALYRRRAYGNVYLMVVAPRLVWGAGVRPGAEVYRTAYRGLIESDSPAARSDFDVYIHDGALYYVRENCRREDAAPRVFLHLFPASDDDLPGHRREYGFDNRSFNFAWRGGFFDGHCITQEPLPNYPIARISTGQQRADGETLWRAEPEPGGLYAVPGNRGRAGRFAPRGRRRGFRAVSGRRESGLPPGNL